MSFPQRPGIRQTELCCNSQRTSGERTFSAREGRFTGAISQKVGRLELRTRAVFLDEVGDIPLELQPKLLPSCRTRNSSAWAAPAPSKWTFAWIAATNRDLAHAVAEKNFAVTCTMAQRLSHPDACAQRTQSDIPALVRHFVQKFSRRMNNRLKSFPAPR